ncbi:hypothetical protein A2526_04710 [candidate division WOR-1 bacterium RIFOXYD2_FULL_36_8]|uniref:DDH domain-containing protein n=1 Tax=candidate division WOR-1 bacterium RIFOXYB2_FULL_36_35 TaxID=1802578 RepID=A0A1F4S6B3_UNCSA|nr:MAG: hypothetical protein A2230_01320 [candidate division WOR-1 bacterium RIFOXYA2_FULL_36_21]OGC14385.1 MAG: hypothetical protein A2282_08035 [candidate division WOR-1 bacterium RIFOXYA12_FULL_36_13]OGC15939.1 MAG: hypothetical protein A2290_06790 [candidate division WOR-1 bacterium RIFOXYB2_FULL_36_35]OGC37265.1 MAG: hypothetical protein A2526_04710 [candidate division WOR-1 bacterium RIFOXYD2_FULL_36_8]
MKKTFQAMKSIISQSKSVIIVCHVDPDGDTLGSMLAMGRILGDMGLDVLMYSPDGVPPSYLFMPGSENIMTHAPKKEFDLMVTVDASGIDRIGQSKIIAHKILNIDHHPDNTNFGDVNCVEQLSSTAEIVYKIAKEFFIKITPQIAIPLYVGIMTDTGSFRFPNTKPTTFLVAKELVENGANPSYLADNIYNTKTIEAIRVCNAAFSRLKHTDDRKVVWTNITREMIIDSGAKADDFTGIIDHLRTIKGIEVALLFREDKNGKIKVNFRSKGKVNVSEIAHECGGGGHILAAGCELDMSMEEAQTKVLNLVKSALEK